MCQQIVTSITVNGVDLNALYVNCVGLQVTLMGSLKQI